MLDDELESVGICAVDGSDAYNTLIETYLTNIHINYVPKPNPRKKYPGLTFYTIIDGKYVDGKDLPLDWKGLVLPYVEPQHNDTFYNAHLPK